MPFTVENDGLVSNHLLYDFHKQDIYPGLKSDHSLVSMSLKIRNSQTKGRGFYKFNSALLKDQTYINGIMSVIANFKVTHAEESNLGLLWDALKSEIRGFSISYGTAKAKEKRRHEKELLME